MRYDGGFNLVEVADNMWFIQPIGGISFGGTFSEVVLVSIYKYGFKMKEIEEAVKVMLELGHDSAHFGVYRTFIFSSKWTKTTERRAS